MTGNGASLLVSAGRDLNIVGGQIDNGGAQGTTFLGAARQVHGAGAVTLKAGADLNLRAANVEAGTALALMAGNNVILQGRDGDEQPARRHVCMEKSFLHKETITTRNTVNRTSGVGSVLNGQTVDVHAGHHLTVLGSAIAGDGDVRTPRPPRMPCWTAASR